MFDLSFFITLAVCCIGALISGLFGFGFPLFAMPVLSLLYTTREAIVVSIPITNLSVWWLTFSTHVTGSTTGMPPATATLGGVLRRFWYMPPAVVVGNLISSLLLHDVNPKWMQITLALMILSYLLLERLPIERLKLQPGRAIAVGILLGVAGGIFESAVNISVVPLLLFARLMQLQRDEMIRFLNLCFLAGRVAQFSSYWQSANIDPQLWQIGLWVCVPAFAFMMLGIHLRRHMKVETYQSGVRGLLIIMASGLIIRAGWI